MLRKTMLIGLIVALGACATADEVRTKPPVFTGKTALPTSEYAGCVQQGWQDAGADAITSIPTKDGVTLTLRGIAGYDLLLDNRSGAVSMYARLPYGYAKFVDVARRCL